MLNHKWVVLSCAMLLPWTPLTAQDPTAAFQASMLGTMKSHPFFKNVDFKPETSYPPYLFYVQRPLKDDPDYYQLVVNSYLPFLAELRRIMEQEYFTPLALPQRQELPAFAIAVLASPGLYDDFARAVDNSFLHMARAHYDQKLHLAVTYQIAFGGRDTADERKSLLHEVVHAMQHAHASTGVMPKPLWYVEGLAEYRSSCTHVASSLREPPLDQDHVGMLAQGYASSRGRAFVLPLAELVAVESYQQVVEAAQKRAPGSDPGLALGMFYAEAEMMVRFLHEAQNGKYRPGFDNYLKAVETGGGGLETFQQAFGADTKAALAAIERDWLVWLTATLKPYYQIGDLAAGKGGNGAELPPPAVIDLSGLGWKPEEIQPRLQLALRRCAQGRYEDGAAMLQQLLTLKADAEQKGLLQRMAVRVAAVVAVREELIKAAQKSGRFKGGAAESWGRFVRRDDSGIVVATGKGKEERTVALAEFTPQVLLESGEKQQLFLRDKVWQRAFLRWLCGTQRPDLKELDDPKAQYTKVRELRQDLVADLDDNYGAGAVALAELQQLSAPQDQASAREALQRLQDVLREHGREALLQGRKEVIDPLARALAERSFGTDDAEAMGVRGAVEKLADGRIRCVYQDPQQVGNADFTLVPPKELDVTQESRIAYDGPTQLWRKSKVWRLIGAGLLRWAVPLSGPQEVEIDYEYTSAQGEFGVVLCHSPGRYLFVDPFGIASIIDEQQRIRDSVGSPPELLREQVHKLRIVHDGKKKLRTWVDGKEVATLPSVGDCLEGELLLLVRSSEAFQLSRISVTGKLAPGDPLKLRDKFVRGVLRQLWP